VRWLTVMVAICIVGVSPDAMAQDGGVANLAAMSARLKGCWQPPALPRGSAGMEITVQFTFKRDGSLLGRPRITYERHDATDGERIIYRTAVMEALQRCAPMPFTSGMGEAIAGRPLTIRFDDRRTLPKAREEKRAWLKTKTL
jgi:hypothetical protein